MICNLLNDNSFITFITFYGHNNGKDEKDIIIFNKELPSLVELTSKHNVKNIRRDMNAQIITKITQTEMGNI